MKQEVFDINKKKVSDIELNKEIFGIEPNDHCIYEAVKNTLANKRQGTHSVLTRAEVNGSTRKPFKQKGTGRARAGMTKSPLWHGGGIIFGPKPRDYSYKIPKKIRQKAYASVFSQFLKDNKLMIVEDIILKEAKTKEMVRIVETLTASRKVMLIVNKRDDKSYENLRLSARNIPWIKTVNVDSIEIKDLFYSDEVLIEKSAVEKLNGRYSK